MISAGIAALAIGFAVGLQAMPARVSVTETSQAKNFDSNLESWAPRGSQTLFDRRWRLASLDTTALLEPAAADRQSDWARSTGRGDVSAEDPAVDADGDGVSFDERFATLFNWPPRRSIVETQEGANPVPLPAPNPGGHAVPRRAAGQSAPGLTQLASLTPAGAARKPLRATDAPEDSLSPDADRRTAIYDISAHRVYLPDGQWLEAHSGLGDRLDDPRYVSEKGRGPTPPNVYDLSLREETFHGVRALRLTPVGGASMFGRDGLLAHSYMLGPNGQSNGCVSINDYPAFLNAYLGGEIDRLVVVEHLANPPAPRTALGWIPQTIRALFGRS